MQHRDESDPWSKSRAEIYANLTEAVASGKEMAVATVTGVEGSAYRRPGAKMLIDTEGGGAGAITAGCLEDSVRKIGQSTIEDGRPRTEKFDLMDDDGWGMGLGCNGIIDIFVEPADGSWRYPLAALEEKRPVTVLTIVESSASDVSVGDRAIVDESGYRAAGADRGDLPEDVARAVLDGWSVEGGHETGVSDVETGDGTVSVFVDRLEPVPDLIVFGSQNDVKPVTELARTVGFEVTVASGRGARAEDDLFPAAHRVEAVAPDDIDEVVRVPEYCYVVVMSHNIVDDRLAIQRLVEDVSVQYIGLMGPEDRFETLLSAVESERPDLEDAIRSAVTTPVGLDLGGGEPAQIALSIVAEALAVSNGRDGSRLSERSGPIHPRST